jgi:hypothetical protein
MKAIVYAIEPETRVRVRYEPRLWFWLTFENGDAPLRKYEMPSRAQPLLLFSHQRQDPWQWSW